MKTTLKQLLFDPIVMPALLLCVCAFLAATAEPINHNYYTSVHIKHGTSPLGVWQAFR